MKLPTAAVAGIRVFGHPGSGGVSVRRQLLCRIGGLPCDHITDLLSPSLAASLAEVLRCDSELEAGREEVAELLHAAVGASAEKTARRRLLSLRRALFNAEQPKPGDLTAADGMPVAAQGVIQRHIGLLDQRDRLTADIQGLFDNELLRGRLALQAQVTAEDFLRGLLLSSQTLFRNVERYRRLNVSVLRARDEQIERGLLRYLTRTAMKATPFGTLCAIVPGRLGGLNAHSRPLGADSIRLNGSPQRRRSFLRLNKRLFPVLWAHLKGRPAIRRRLVVELNSTAHAALGTVRFLTGTDGREVFHRVDQSDAVNLIVQMVSQGAPLVYGELIACLRADPGVEASEDQANRYIDGLIEVGLLQLRSGVADHDANWAVSFAESLESIPDEEAAAVASLLRRMSDWLALCALSEAKERLGIIEQMQSATEETFVALGIPRERMPSLPFYEDAAADAELVVDMTPSIEQALQGLAEWVTLMLPLAAPVAEQATLAHFFTAYYGAEKSAVPLLEFYEDFFREHFKSHLNRVRDSAAWSAERVRDPHDLANPFGLAAVDDVLAARRAIGELIRARWAASPNAEEIVLSSAELAPLLAGATGPVRRSSVAVFCQLVPESAVGRPARVVVSGGGIVVGYGKFFSRFLYMLGDEFGRELRHDNDSGDGIWLVDIADNAHFNANLHPPILPRELRYPTVEAGTHENQVDVTDLDVVPAGDGTNALRLVHRPSGCTVVPIDLGFLTPHLRPALFQLLSFFSPPGRVSFPVPDRASRRSEKDLPESRPLVACDNRSTVEYRPRITYASSVVLARRRWTIPGDLLPRRQPNEHAAAYALRLNRWRVRNEIPNQVYVRVQRLDSQAVSPAASSPLARPDHDAVYAVGADDWVDPEIISDGESTALSSPLDDSPPANDPTSAVRSRSSPRRDNWHKPQFIDFSSPLLIGIFARVSSSLSNFTLFVEERLPSHDSLPRGNARPYVHECTLQLDIGPIAADENRMCD